MDNLEYKIAIIGLGYVGLPLAVEFGKKYHVVGFDINNKRIQELKNGIDVTLEVESSELADSKLLTFTSNHNEIKDCNIYIITVPTPIDKYNKPDLLPLIKASKTVGDVLAKGDIVVYESTVFPGCTEEQCVPVLEDISGLKFNVDFYCGYSPERINPGDKHHRLKTIKKVVAGSTSTVSKKLVHLYGSIIEAGIHESPSIKVAEASKVIENSQRDINIAFVNELAIIFEKIGIDTTEVLEAAGTKWNFLKFKPGLVGGHCIGVDPYYLAQKAQEVGYHPEIILAGRRLNDSMGKYIASEVVKLMIKNSLPILNANILILGFSFKENCPDFRNTKVIDIVNELKSYGCNIDIHDPCVNYFAVKEEYGIDILSSYPSKKYHSIILAVSHDEYHDISSFEYLIKEGIVYDVKSFWDKSKITKRL